MEYGLTAGTDTNKLLEDKRKASGLKADLTTEAIQALEEGLKTKAIPKDEDDRQMSKEEIKKAKEAEKRVAQKLKVKNAMRNKWEFINDEIAEEVKADEAKLNERFKKKQGVIERIISYEKEIEMEITGINAENAGYFKHLCPEEILNDEESVKFGVIDDDEG